MRNDFGCNTADGLELEDDGGRATAGSHWEERIMYGDYMIGMNSGGISAISEITLALLEDSGWYKTNKFTGGLFMFGRKKGCGFLKGKCISRKGRSRFKNEYCVKDKERGCSANRRWKSICTAKKVYARSVKKKLKFQYVQNINGDKVILTGNRPYSDTCPIPEIPGNSKLAYSCFYGKTNRKKNGPISFYEKVRGNNNACFLSNVMSKNASFKKINNSFPYRSGCYEHICDFGKKTIKIKINSKNYECPSRGGIINIVDPFIKGKIVCPDFYFLCNQSIKCDHLVDCVFKKSIRIDEPEMLNFESLANMESNLVENMNVKQVKGNKF